MREPSMTMHPYSLRPVADEQQAANQLQQRVEQLQQMSLQLGNSYGLLEARVSELKGQLAQASAERLEQLAEKERLAQRLQSLLDILPGGVVVLDGRGRVVEANPLALELLGEPLLGVFWREVIQRSFAPRADDGHEISLQDGRRLSLATRSLADLRPKSSIQRRVRSSSPRVRCNSLCSSAGCSRAKASKSRRVKTQTCASVSAVTPWPVVAPKGRPMKSDG